MTPQAFIGFHRYVSTIEGLKKVSCNIKLVRNKRTTRSSQGDKKDSKKVLTYKKVSSSIELVRQSNKKSNKKDSKKA